ncbi:MAG: SDR family NAD(P)-dependent oxidoreductase [Flavobacteriales bacterium]|nr:SDR family NAD(P)-dependent oxidoreductase [Flavobacteriales bacterium]
MDLKGKHILLTGGSLGIGKSTAKMLVDKGAKVLITGRNAERLKVASEYSGAEAIVFDVSDLDNLSRNAQNCLDLLGGKVDAIINNAGVGSFEKVEDISQEQFLEVFNTNVFGLALLSKEIIPTMKSQQSGTIINIGSSASVKGFARGSVYAASKFAVRALTQCWQAELRPFNIRVCQLNPSEVTTAFYNQERIERVDEDNKLSPNEIAHSIVSVLEMDNKGFITELNVWATNPF